MENLHRKVLRCVLAMAALLLTTTACEMQNQPKDTEVRARAARGAKATADAPILVPGVHAGDEGP